MRIHMFILAGLSLSAVCAFGQVVNGIQALVSDSVITDLELRAAVAPATQFLRREYGNDVAALNARFAQIMTEELDTLMERQLILHEFNNSGYELPESLIDEEIQSRIRTQWEDRRTLTKELQLQGRTYESFRRQMRDDLIIGAMTRQVLGKPQIISPLKIQNYYEQHLEDYRLGEQVRLSMIVLNKTGATNDPAPALAAELLKKIEQGESFGDLAATYSEGSQRQKRGDWGWVERSVLREDLAEVAFSLKPGEVSEVIETEQSCYIMRVEEVKDSHFQPLTEVQEDIERTLQAEQQTADKDRWIERLKRKTFIRYY